VIVFFHVGEAIQVANAAGLKPTRIFLGTVKSEAFRAGMRATGGETEPGGDTYFCGLLVTFDSPTPGITVC
jgi:hypothetical protein